MMPHRLEADETSTGLPPVNLGTAERVRMFPENINPEASAVNDSAEARSWKGLPVSYAPRL